jgi:hypothetical protein
MKTVTSMVRVVGLVRAATVVLSMLGAACANQPPGALVLAIETDVPLPKDVDSVELQVSADGNTQFDNMYQVGNGTLLIPATLTLLPGSTAGAPVTIHLIAYRAGAMRMLKETVTTVPTSRIATLTLPIEWLSFGVTCSPGETPEEGTCVSSNVQSSTLPTYAATAIFGGGNGTGSGQCFDLLPCFADSVAASLDAASCSVPDPGGPNVNVAIELSASSGDGQCGANGCLVPVPSGDGHSGWTRAGGSITLPPAVCAGPAKSSINAVRTSTRCATAVAGAPRCGPWSSVTSPGIDAGDATGALSSDAGDATVGHSSDAAGCPRDVCPVPVVSVASPKLDSIAVDSTSLYWIDGTSLVVMKMPLDGGTPVTLAQGAGNPMLGAGSLNVDARGVYWSSTGQINFNEVSYVLRTGLDGGAPVTLASQQGLTGPVLDPSGNVYWYDTAAATINRLAADA